MVKHTFKPWGALHRRLLAGIKVVFSSLGNCYSTPRSVECFGSFNFFSSFSFSTFGWLYYLIDPPQNGVEPKTFSTILDWMKLSGERFCPAERGQPVKAYRWG